MTSFIFGELKDLVSSPRATNQSHIAFEGLFSAQMSNVNSMDPISAFPECMASYYLLDVAYIDDCQRIAIMGTASPKDAWLTSRSLTRPFLRVVT